eukprot:TRINITY_DN36169_c0_g1_i1.p2 TRINITY_DN36169_c0_g1~~TRINITY_DN36169_c0_g1_i1.p2  ORF type:complete len:270 (+),score=45.43 TRINITY_DN36169_c0_g1_i1:58-867(+)
MAGGRSKWEQEWLDNEALAGAWHSLGAGIGTKYRIMRCGGEATVIKGSRVTVHAKGRLDGKEKPFWNTRDAGNEPFTYTSAALQVIRGWDFGCLGMGIGELRELLIPGHEGYKNGFPAWQIPAGATLHFEIEVLDITGKKGPPPVPLKVREQRQQLRLKQEREEEEEYAPPPKRPARAAASQPDGAPKLPPAKLSRGFAFLQAAQQGLVSAEDEGSPEPEPRSPPAKQPGRASPHRSPSAGSFDDKTEPGEDDAAPPAAADGEDEGYDY